MVSWHKIIKSKTGSVNKTYMFEGHHWARSDPRLSISQIKKVETKGRLEDELAELEKEKERKEEAMIADLLKDLH